MSLYRWRLPGLVALTACACLFASPLLAAGKLETVAKFQTGLSSFLVQTYTDRAEQPSKVGLIKIEVGPQQNAFAFRPEEWTGLIRLVTTAANGRSSGSWSVIGELNEKETSDPSHMVISAGPGIRFALNSPKGPSVTYVLPTGEVAALRNALDKAKTYLTQPEPPAEDTGPVGALHGFFAAVAADNYAAAWAALTAKTQDFFAKSLAESEHLSVAAARKLFDDDDESVRSGFWSEFHKKSHPEKFDKFQMTPVAVSGDDGGVQISSGNKHLTFKMHKEHGRWKVGWLETFFPDGKPPEKK